MAHESVYPLLRAVTGSNMRVEPIDCFRGESLQPLMEF